MLRTYIRLNDLKSRVARFVREEAAQDAFEYLLVIGAVMVAVVVAVAAGGSGPVDAVWAAVQTSVVDATDGILGN